MFPKMDTIEQKLFFDFFNRQGSPFYIIDHGIENVVHWQKASYE